MNEEFLSLIVVYNAKLPFFRFLCILMLFNVNRYDFTLSLIGIIILILCDRSRFGWWWKCVKMYRGAKICIVLIQSCYYFEQQRWIEWDNNLGINRVQIIEKNMRFTIIIVQFHARLHRALYTAHNFNCVNNKLCI